MNDFKTISAKELLIYAMKGLADHIVKAPFEELDALNAKYDEMYHRRKKIIADESEAPF